MEDKLSPEVFGRISRFIENNFGIRVPLEKKILVQSRLARRVRELQYPSIDEYIRGLLELDASHEEISKMIDLITTHMTSFYREPRHFDYLRTSVLPLVCEGRRFSRHQPLILWSAACSTGEEAYTLAMVADRFRREVPGQRGLEFAVLGTDLSEGCLQVARKGVYPRSSLDSIPLEDRRDYVMHSQEASRAEIRVVPELRNRVFFEPLNLLAARYEINNAVHVIFCRNVLIYFERQIQQKVVDRLAQTLQGGGFLFLGHAEALPIGVPSLDPVAPTVYRKAVRPVSGGSS